MAGQRQDQDPNPRRTPGLLCTGEESPEGPETRCCPGTGSPALPRVSAFLTGLVRLLCDSCTACRLVTRTHRLMLMSPRKQKATVRGVGGGAAGALWAALRAGPACCPRLTLTRGASRKRPPAHPGSRHGGGPYSTLAHTLLGSPIVTWECGHSKWGAQQARPGL